MWLHLQWGQQDPPESLPRRRQASVTTVRASYVTQTLQFYVAEWQNQYCD